MSDQASIYQKHYADYLTQLGGHDLAQAATRLGLAGDERQVKVTLLQNDYTVSAQGISDQAGRQPRYTHCVLLAKYILRSPQTAPYEPDWVSFKDFKAESHFTNTNYFTSATQKPLIKNFAGGLDRLAAACDAVGGAPEPSHESYDLAMSFPALPTIRLLLLFNDGDDEFPAQGSVLYQKHAEHYLDPESLIILGAILLDELVANNPPAKTP